jgi:hypothetical protein
MMLFQKHFDGELPAIEALLIQHLRNVPYVDPFAEWPHWAAFVALPDGDGVNRQANIFHTPELAEKWVRETLAAATADQRARAKTAIREFPNRVAGERYARQFLGNQ